MDRSCYKRQATICGKHRLKSVQAASDRRPPPLQPGQNNKELSRLWRHFSFYPVSVQEAQDFFFKSCRLRGKEGVMVWDFLKCSVDLGKLKDLKGMGNRGPWSLKAEFLRQNDPSLPETNRQEPLFGGGGNSLCLGPYCFPGGSDVKKICLQCRRPGFSPWVGKIFWRREQLPFSVFFWRIPWTEERGRLQSMGSHRVGHKGMSKHTHMAILVYLSIVSVQSL